MEKAKELWAIFKNKKIDCTQQEDYLKVAHMLMLWYMVLGYSNERKLESWMFVLADDLSSWNRFPWGAYSYMALVHYINHIPTTLATLGPTLNLSGPIWALMVCIHFYYFLFMMHCLDVIYL